MAIVRLIATVEGIVAQFVERSGEGQLHEAGAVGERALADGGGDSLHGWSDVCRLRRTRRASHSGVPQSRLRVPHSLQPGQA